VLSRWTAPATGKLLGTLVATCAKPIGLRKRTASNRVDARSAPTDAVQGKQPRPIKLCALDHMAARAQRKIALMSGHARCKARTELAGKPTECLRLDSVSDGLPQHRLAQESCDDLDG
jgi:hypothetical protein